MTHLDERFHTACDCPLTEGKLFEDLGHLANTPAATAILERQYEFPENVDRATKLLLEKAADIYAKNKGRVSTIVENKDFSSFWMTAREKT